MNYSLTNIRRDIENSEIDPLILILIFMLILNININIQLPITTIIKLIDLSMSFIANIAKKVYKNTFHYEENKANK